MKVSMPNEMSHGWGVAGHYLTREIAKLPHIDGVTLHCVRCHDFAPLDETAWDRINIGYCFFEEEIIAYHYVPEMIKRWDYMVAGSSWCEHHLRIAGMDRTTTILQGIDSERFYFRPPLQDNQKFIVFSGGKFEFRKGQDIVIAAMKIFMARHDDVWLAAAWHNHWPDSIKTMNQSRLIDFNSFDDPCNDLYAQTLLRNGIDMQRVILYPRIDNMFMADIYANSHIGLFPNRCEGGNNMVLCEYMACGRPVIASNRTGHADVITGDNAFPLSRYEPVIARNNGIESGIWFEADVTEVVELLEQAYREQDLLRRKAGYAAADMSKLSWAETALRFHAAGRQISEARSSELVHKKTPAEQIEEASLLFRNGKLEPSENIFNELLNKFPLNPDLHNSLATVLDAEQRYLEAAAHYTKALSLQPGFLVARFNLANTLKRMGDIEGCRENLQEVVENDSGFIPAWQNLASLYFDTGNLEESARCLEHVISTSPEKILAWAELGDVYHRLGDADEKALSCFERVIANKPDFAAAYNSKGLIIHEQGDYEGAENCYRAALAFEPDDPCFMNNLGLLLMATGKIEEAILWFDRSIGVEDSPTTHFNRGMARLLTGDYGKGWEDYEHRFEKNDPVYLPAMAIPRWSGEDLSGKTIIVRMEQGYGDCIQCLRYLQELHKRSAKIILECLDDRIKQLFVGRKEIDSLYLRGETPPVAHLQIPLFSLPQIFGTNLSNIPCSDGYIEADQALSCIWKSRIEATTVGGTVKVGLVWGGRKTRLNANRSLFLDDLAPFFSLPGISWFSLQVGEDAQQLENYKELLLDIGGECVTFADTAAAITNLDLVITIDTSVAHLCGALGVPAWVLLKAAPDWRWLLERSDSPWYRSLTLIRQTVTGEWGNVVREIITKLKSMTS